MKKLLPILLGLTLFAQSALATTSVPWQQTNLTDKFIFPALVNGNTMGIIVKASSTLQDTTMRNATATNATTTNFFSIIASSSKLFTAQSNGCVQITNGQLLSIGANCGTGSGSVTSVSDNGGGTLTISPTTGSVLAGINLANPNTWTGGQIFGNTTTTNATTTTLTIKSILSKLLLTDANGVVSPYTGTTCTNQFIRALSVLGVATCNTVQNTDLANSSITVNGTVFNLGDSKTVTAASSTLLGDNNSFTGATTLNTTLHTGSTTLQNFTALNSTSSNATTTNLFSNTASTTNLFVATGPCSGGNALNVVNGKITCGSVTVTSAASSTLLGDNNTFSGANNFATMLVNGSSTLQNFTGLNSTTTNATTSNSFSGVASSSKLFTASFSGAGLASCSGTNALSWTAGLFGCVAIPQGTVTSVTGTANRITSTGGATPQIDISGSYVGQASITTIGTLSSGAVPASLVTSGTFGSGNYVFPSQVEHDGSTTLQNFTGLQSTTTNSTSTNLFASIASTTSLFLATGNCSGSSALNVVIGKVVCGAISGVSAASSTLYADNGNFIGSNQFANLLVNGSTTLQNFTGLNSTSTNATSSAFAILTVLNCNGNSVLETNSTGGVQCGADNAASTTLLTDNNHFTGGNIFTASTTIGDGSWAGGLTVSGSATTSGTTTLANGAGMPHVAIGAALPNYGYLPNDLLNVTGNSGGLNDYLAINMVNPNAGTCATADLTAANNLASNAAFFADLGHTSSGFTGVGCTNNPFTAFSANSTYLFDPSGNMNFALGSTTALTNFRWFGGGYGTSNQLMNLSTNGRLGLGTTTSQWQLELSTSTRPQLALSDGTLTDGIWTERNAGGNFYGDFANPSTFATSSVSKFTVLSNGNVGIGTSTPWAELSVASSSPNYTNPLFAISTSTLNLGQIITAFATTSSMIGEAIPTLDDGARVVIGATPTGMLLDQLFVNGRVSSAWQYNACDSFSITQTVSSVLDNICGFMTWRETVNASLGPVGGSDNYSLGGQLTMAGAATADNSTLILGAAIPAAGLGSTTPIMETRVVLQAPISSTTESIIGFTQSFMVVNNGGCMVAATSTNNWQAICDTDSSHVTQVDTGVATSTTVDTLFRLELAPNRFTVYSKTSPYNSMTKVAEITSNIPGAASGLTLQPQITRFRVTGGNSTIPTMNVWSIRYWRQNPWEANQ